MNLNIIRRTVIFVLLAVILVGCAPESPLFARFVQLNSQLQLLIEAAVIFLVGWLFDYLIAKWPWLSNWLDQYRDTVALALAGVVVGAVQDLLNLVPPAWEEVGLLAQALLVAVLVALGAFKFFKHNANVRAFQN